jgi:hypothetical protein
MRFIRSMREWLSDDSLVDAAAVVDGERHPARCGRRRDTQPGSGRTLAGVNDRAAMPLCAAWEPNHCATLDALIKTRTAKRRTAEAPAQKDGSPV